MKCNNILTIEESEGDRLAFLVKGWPAIRELVLIKSSGGGRLFDEMPTRLSRSFNIVKIESVKKVESLL